MPIATSETCHSGSGWCQKRVAVVTMVDLSLVTGVCGTMGHVMGISDCNKTRTEYGLPASD
ncbi:hypothetical protein J6590_054816 [Homalodisca vitripennis]|nr:hypothetical protein J6590_054816 [Homalodisca vitripennis]